MNMNCFFGNICTEKNITPTPPPPPPPPHPIYSETAKEQAFFGI